MILPTSRGRRGHLEVAASVGIADRAEALEVVDERWVRFPRQFGGLAKVDSGFGYAANFACSLPIA
jgi:hypothetical protein